MIDLHRGMRSEIDKLYLDGKYVGAVDHHHAAEIARRWNAHEVLVAACEALDAIRGGDSVSPLWDKVAAVRQMARDALAKAKA